MAVMARESWTDERLDEFKENVNYRFDEVDKRLDRVEAQMTQGFARVDGDIRELRQSIERLTVVMVTGLIGLGGLIVSGAVFF